MNAAREGNVRFLVEEKYTTLSEQNGWSLAFAEGYVNGQAARWRGIPPSSYIIVGVDDYALGFRAGYFERLNPDRPSGRPEGKPGSKTINENDSTSVM